MFRFLNSAVLAGMIALGAAATAAAQESYPEPSQQLKAMGSAPATQTGHLSEAIKHTQAAIDAANAGQASLVAQEAQTALTHAQAAEKEKPSPNLEVAIKRLQDAVKHGKAGKASDAMKAAQEALGKLQA